MAPNTIRPFSPGRFDPPAYRRRAGQPVKVVTDRCVLLVTTDVLEKTELGNCVGGGRSRGRKADLIAARADEKAGGDPSPDQCTADRHDDGQQDEDIGEPQEAYRAVFVIELVGAVLQVVVGAKNNGEYQDECSENYTQRACEFCFYIVFGMHDISRSNFTRS